MNNIEIYADGADLEQMKAAAADPMIAGLTTNPTLMRKSGVTDYLAFAREAVAIVGDKPLSLEVFSDEFDDMERQARLLADLGAAVFVKIPITNTRGESSCPLVQRLTANGVRVNVTAILTLEQVRNVARVLNPNVPAIVSVFAGRIADTCEDPEHTMRESRRLLLGLPLAKLLWASPREVLNIVQARWFGAQIITVTSELLAKFRKMRGTDLAELSLATVRMFRTDAVACGYTL